jgi:hypothetical protein
MDAELVPLSRLFQEIVKHLNRSGIWLHAANVNASALRQPHAVPRFLMHLRKQRLIVQEGNFHGSSRLKVIGTAHESFTPIGSCEREGAIRFDNEIYASPSTAFLIDET